MAMLAKIRGSLRGAIKKPPGEPAVVETRRVSSARAIHIAIVCVCDQIPAAPRRPSRRAPRKSARERGSA